MRRFILLLLTVIAGIFFFAGSADAMPKTRQQAQSDVEAFLSQRGISLKVERSMARGQQEDSQESIYFFDIEGGNGFVIASGSDSTPAILGYTDSGSYDEDALPENMKVWLEGYRRQIENAHSASTRSSMAATRGALPNHAKIAPMLTTKWDQGYPYNLKCPSSGFTRCVTGCGATAIAQIMYYHRKNSIRELPRELKGYRYKNSDISVNTFPKGSAIDWDNMLTSYSTSSFGGETTAQKNAVAYLMAYLGSAMKMEYGTEGSSSNLYNVRSAMITYFNYSETMTLEERENYTDTEWDNLVYSELAAGRPVNYTGIAVDGEEKSGHSFVCDGYDGNGYYHINWGWGGTADGCFLLSALNPEDQGTGGASSAYNTEQEILIGIVPKDLKYADYEAYAAKDNGTLTFYYDQQRASRGEETYDMEKVQTTTVIYVNPRPNWNDSYEEVTDITKVKFDKSFAAWHPTSTYYWFYWFTKLNSIEGMENLNADHVKEQAYMFGNCENLKDIKLPAGLKLIGSSMFTNCKSLKSVVIPSSVSSIDNYAFYDCKNLTTITSYIQAPFEINSGTFPYAVYSSATLKVPAGKKSVYQSTSGWNLFSDIKELPKQTIEYKPGDANGDGKVDVADIVAIVNHIKKVTPVGFNADNADLNHDNKVDMTDVNELSEMILPGGKESGTNPDTGNDPAPVEPTPVNPTPDNPSNDDPDTDKITASFTGGAYSSINGKIQSGSKLNVRFSNNSSQSVTITKIQLNDAQTGREGNNLLSEEVVVGAGQSVSYTITIGSSGIYKPVIRFTYRYKNKTYQVEDEWKEFEIPDIHFPDF